MINKPVTIDYLNNVFSVYKSKITKNYWTLRFNTLHLKEPVIGSNTMFNPSTLHFSKKLAYSVKAALLTFTLVSANQAFSKEEVVTVPTMNDARVFAEFVDKMPAVVNYFTKSTEQEVIKFYQNEYGQQLGQERKRGRLTLNFNQDKKNIRVVISQQNRLRQVDVIIETKPKN